MRFYNPMHLSGQIRELNFPTSWTVIHSLAHSFNKCLWSLYSVPDAGWDTGAPRRKMPSVATACWGTHTHLAVCYLGNVWNKDEAIQMLLFNYIYELYNKRWVWAILNWILSLSLIFPQSRTAELTTINILGEILTASFIPAHTYTYTWIYANSQKYTIYVWLGLYLNHFINGFSAPNFSFEILKLNE